MAKQLQLPGFGKNGMSTKDGEPLDLDSAEDFYLRGMCNIAYQAGKPVPEASDDDIALTGVTRWMPEVEKRLKPEEVRRVAMVMSRGGRFDKIEDAWKGEQIKAAYKFPVQLWHEGLAKMRHSMTGERYSGCPTWYPTRLADGSDMRQVFSEQDWPLTMTSYKSNLMSSMSIAASRLRRTILDLQTQLDALDNISPDEQEDFKRREGEIAQATQRRDDFMRRLGSVDTESTHLQTQLDKIKTEINHKQTEQVKGEINSRRIARARQAQQLFEDYKQRLKDSRREDIERQINLRFKSLMSSHGQIERITIDADFALTYLSADGQEVGMANISAGMKQLMAHALQWALKDFTGSLAPVIFDSPLGRLDRSHQNNLLEHFYHRVAHQVILLPTDSELDIEKYRLIQPYVCAEFRLENADGEHTHVIPNARMYDLETA